MKTNEDVRKTETFEDIVFEGRNKSYGAFELKKKRNRYLMVSFLVTFVGFTTAVAVPFLDSLKADHIKTVPFDSKPVIITGIKPDRPEITLPPPPPLITKSMEKTVSYKIPDVVEEITETGIELSTEIIAQGAILKPADIEIENFPTGGGGVIDEPEEEKIVLFPSEPAVFMGCPDLACFHKWIVENIRYPEDAAAGNVFGRVILEFCVNSKGKIVDINVLRSIHPSLDKEAIRVISSSPLWTPAKQGGTPVKQKFVIPCSFEMN